MQYQNGEEFLNYLNKNMHLEDIVMHTAEKSDTPVKKINKYMLRLERIHNMTKNNKHKMNILKQLYRVSFLLLLTIMLTIKKLNPIIAVE